MILLDTVAHRVVGKEGRMNESIIVGLVVGVVVALASGYVSHYLRKREMEALWAEEERRRKSDRRRELYEKALGVVGQAMDAWIQLMASMHYMEVGNTKQVEAWLVESFRKTSVAATQGVVMAASLEDEQLARRYDEFKLRLVDWLGLLDSATGKVKEGEEEKFGELQAETLALASLIRSRIREMLEEV